MSVRKSAVIALRSLGRNRLQTVLTVVGMTIGVGTVLVMIAVGSGAERSISGQVRAAGMNVIVVSSGNYRMEQQWTSQGEAEEPAAFSPDVERPELSHGVWRPGFRVRLRTVQSQPADNPIQQLERSASNLAGRGAATTLSLEDASAIAGMSGVQAVSGGVHENATIRLDAGGNATGDGAKEQAFPARAGALTVVRGEQASLLAIRRAWVLPYGRFFSADEDAHGAKVAVLGSVLAEQLFGTRNPVGEGVVWNGVAFRVVGEVASGSWMVPSAKGDGQFDAMYVPVHTAQGVVKRRYLDTVTISTESTGDVTHVTKELTATLRARHGLAENRADDFTVASQARAAIAHGGMRTDISRAMMGNAGNLDKVTLAQLSKTLEQASRTMAVLLASIAAVSLVVGGIGIMNIMLLSVTERTREIGIRRAVGAQSAEVMQQFLLEAIILSVGGGLLGIAAGASAAVAVARLVQWSTELSSVAIAVSFGVSAFVGVAFGYYPARQASHVSPMTSLRYE